MTYVHFILNSTLNFTKKVPMKKLIVVCTSLFISAHLYSQSISVPPEPSPSVSHPELFKPKEFELGTLNQKSEDSRGMAKLTSVGSSPSCATTFGTPWHQGAWGLGYFSTSIESFNGSPSHYFEDPDPTTTQPVSAICDWYMLSTSCSAPTTDHTADAIRANVQQFRFNQSSTALLAINHGLNYLIAIQNPNGSYSTYERSPGQLTHWPEDNYKITAEALVALTDAFNLFTLDPTITYGNMTGLLQTIIEASDYLLAYRQSEGQQCSGCDPNNSNYKSFALTGLSRTAIITSYPRFITECKILAAQIANDQDKVSINEKGMFKYYSFINNAYQTDPITTGGTTYTVYHDAILHYHMIVLRGLVDALTVFEINNNTTEFQSALSTFMLGLNYLIEKRFNPDQVTGANLQTYPEFAFKPNPADPWVPIPIGNYKFGHNYGYEALTTFLTFSKYSDLISDEDRYNLNLFINAISQSLDDENLLHFPAIVYCLDKREDYCSGNLQKPTIIQDGNQVTWTTNKMLRGDLIIKPGSQLTIQGTVNMMAGTSVIVEQDAQLILDGCTITNNCGKMWNGIEVWGTPGQSQIPLIGNTNHGYVELINGATIEYAKTGVLMGKSHSVDPVDWAYTGGILKAEGGNFVNCKVGVDFYSFHNVSPTSNTILGNASIIKNCHFKTSDDLLDGTSSMNTTFIRLYDVEGVRLFGNKFEYAVGANWNQGGTAIKSVNSGFRLESSPQGRNEFLNMDMGIDSKSISGLEFVKIDDCDFYQNVHAIYLRGHNASQITRNDILLMGVDCIGAFLSECNGYKFEQNSISGTTLSSSNLYGKIGMYAWDNTNAGNLIYRNEFNENLNWGIVFGGDNTGLKFYCNEFEYAEKGVLVMGGKGIHPHQGLDIAYSYPNGAISCKEAGNLFTGMNYDIFIDQNNPNFNINPGPIKYIYSTTNPSEEPINITNNVLKVNCPNNNNNCPSTVPGVVTLPSPTDLMNTLGLVRSLLNDPDNDEDQFLHYGHHYSSLYNQLIFSHISEVEEVNDIEYDSP